MAPTVLQAIVDEAGGWISFRRFMQEALYHPRHGYYSTAVREVGPRGDFSTATSLHPVLGEAVAAWALMRRRELLPRGRTHLIEIGAGSGQLARAVLRALGLRGRLSTRYHIVELSPPLQHAQRRLLGRAVRWHASVDAALASANGRALVFSNELVDAFACHRLIRRRGGWREIGLRLVDGRGVEEERDPEDARVSSDLCSAPRELAGAPDGQRCEVHLPYHDWLGGWIGALDRGALLTIDYGDTVESLYHGRRHGTARAYFQHLALEGMAIYGQFGRQDLTADVNFTDLQCWGEARGLRTTSWLTQGDFLTAWVPELERRAQAEPALAYVSHPAGPGGAFRVLEQVRS